VLMMMVVTSKALELVWICVARQTKTYSKSKSSVNL
jgi:hypothetical protein